MDSFSKVEHSDRSFNVTFSTVVSIVVSFIIIGIITYYGFFLLPYSWCVYVALALFPAVMYAVAITQSTEYRMAYYKKWADSMLGVLDRRKILKDFMQKYNIDTYKVKAANIKADGRWHFKVSTNHVRDLIEKRDAVLSHLEDDLLRGEKRLNEVIERREKDLANENVTRAALEKRLDIAAQQLKGAIAPGAIFQARLDYDACDKDLHDSNQRINEAQFDLNVAKDQKDKLRRTIENAISRAKSYYYLRYQNYTSSAIKEINAVNGLKYKIEDMGDGK